MDVSKGDSVCYRLITNARRARTEWFVLQLAHIQERTRTMADQTDPAPRPAPEVQINDIILPNQTRYN
jgi:hypothetical protein